MTKPDFAAEFVALAREVAEIDASASVRIEAELRRRYGGEQVRIAERAPLTLSVIDGLLRERKPVRQVANELGVSRATIYRHIGRKNIKSQGDA